MTNEKYIRNTQYGNLFVVENKKHEWGIIDADDNVIVPFGKYDWIDGFDQGLARVKIGHVSSSVLNFLNKRGKGEKLLPNKWGIINKQGKEVLPVEYDSVWNFKGKNHYFTFAEKNGNRIKVYFYDLITDTFDRSNDSYSDKSSCYDDDYGTHYGMYAGSYAQDIMGYSDDVISDAFEGDPDCYWNID